MQVVQKDGERLAGRGSSQEGGERLEELKPDALGVGSLPVPDIGKQLPKLGKDRGEFRGPAPELRSQRVLIALAYIRPQRLDPRPVDGRTARLPTAAEKYPRAVVSRTCEQLLGEAALADARLTREQEKAPPAGQCVVESGDELGQLGFAARKAASRDHLRRLPRGRLLRHRGELKLRVLGEYRPLELSETFSRLDAQLLHQCPASILVGLQRVSLAVRAVEGEHQLRPEPLSVRMVADQRLELCDHLGMTAEVQLGLDEVLPGRDPRLLETADLALRERLVGEFRQRRATPQRQGLFEYRQSAFRVAAGQLAAALDHEPFKALRVEPVGTQRLVGVHQEQRQQRPLLAPDERDFAALMENLERAEYAEVHCQ